MINRRIPMRSRHRLSDQLNILCRLVAPSLAEWSPTVNRWCSLRRWDGPLPQPDGTALRANHVVAVVAGQKHVQWFLAVSPSAERSRLLCEFVARVGAPNCPNPRWWKLRCSPITAAVQLHWATEARKERAS